MSKVIDLLLAINGCHELVYFHLLSPLDRVPSSLESFVVHFRMATGCAQAPTASHLSLIAIELLYLNASKHA